MKYLSAIIRNSLKPVTRPVGTTAGSSLPFDQDVAPAMDGSVEGANSDLDFNPVTSDGRKAETHPAESPPIDRPAHGAEPDPASEVSAIATTAGAQDPANNIVTGSDQLSEVETAETYPDRSRKDRRRPVQAISIDERPGVSVRSDHRQGVDELSWQPMTQQTHDTPRQKENTIRTRPEYAPTEVPQMPSTDDSDQHGNQPLKQVTTILAGQSHQSSNPGDADGDSGVIVETVKNVPHDHEAVTAVDKTPVTTPHSSTPPDKPQQPIPQVRIGQINVLVDEQGGNDTPRRSSSRPPAARISPFGLRGL